MSEELKPVAWMFRSEDGRDCVSYTKKCAEEWSAQGEIVRPLFLIPEGYALVPVEQAKNAERYEHIRGQFGYGRRGVFLPCGVVMDEDRERYAMEADEAIDAEIAATTETK